MNRKERSTLIRDAMEWHAGVGPHRFGDPFCRLSTLDQDCILLVAFCERDGPRPVLLVQSPDMSKY